MNCEELHALIDEGDDALSSSRALADAHLAICAECREMWNAYRRWAGLEVPRTPHGLRARVAAALEGAERRAASARGKLRAPLLTAGFAAVGAALAGAVAYFGDSPFAEPETSAADEPRPPRASPRTSPAQPSSSVARPTESRGEPTTDGVAEPTPLTQGVDEGALPGYSVDPNSILVLPGSPRTDRRLDALLDAVESKLTETAGLNVLGPDRALPFLEAGIREERIAEVLGAGYVLIVELDDPPSDFVEALLLDGRSGEARAGLAGGSAMPPAGEIDWRPRAESIARLVLREHDPAVRASDDRNAEADVLNTTLSELERITALARLGRSVENGRVSLPEPVIIAAVDMALASTDPATKRSVWTLLKDTGHPYLIAPLIRSLAAEPDPTVRALAAYTLEDFADLPEVREALARAHDADASEDVRRSAAASLMTDDERRSRATP